MATTARSRPCAWRPRAPIPQAPRQPVPSIFPFSGARAADRDAIDADGRQSHSDRDRLTVLAAGSPEPDFVGLPEPSDAPPIENYFLSANPSLVFLIVLSRFRAK